MGAKGGGAVGRGGVDAGRPVRVLGTRVSLQQGVGRCTLRQAAAFPGANWDGQPCMPGYMFALQMTPQLTNRAIVIIQIL